MNRDRMREFTVNRYDDSQKNIWENFINGGNTVLGTFLHSRLFLDYHPKERFYDHSILVYDGNSLLAIIPACEMVIDGKKTFYSHRGATFGGPVILAKRYTAEYVHDLLKNVENYLISAGFQSVYYKLTPSVYCESGNELFQYLFQYLNYSEYRELSTGVEFANYKSDILANFEQGKRTNVNNCIKYGYELKKIENRDGLAEFYALLCDNLKKYDTMPVHSFEELLDLKECRLKDIMEFFGVYDGNKLISGSMMFYFSESKKWHTQYLCADSEYTKQSPMTFMYYSMIRLAKERDMNGVTWGTSTEQNGKFLNFGLIRSKEAFGGRHYLNQTFYKVLQ